MPPLSGGTPRRLLYQAGKWVLEVMRHVNLSQGLIRPTTQRLSGARVINSYFASNPEAALLGRAAQRLMQGAQAEGPRTYSAEGAEWIANSIAPPPGGGDSYPAPASEETPESRLDDLNARVVGLTLVQEGLLARLARLEAKLARGSFVAEVGAGAEAEAQLESGFDDEAASEPGADPGFDETPEASASMPSEPPAASTEAAAGAKVGAQAKAAPAQPEGRPPEPEPEPAPPPPAADAAPEWLELELPSVPDLAKCMAQLVGGDVSAKKAEPLPVNRTTKDHYGAAILDDTDRVVGVVLMDLKAAVFLGGTLMMLPKMELDQQLKAASPGEDSIAASSEICNALSGTINGAQPQHIRMGPLEKFEFKAWSWVTDPAHRRDLEDSFGGRTVVLSRRRPQQIF